MAEHRSPVSAAARTAVRFVVYGALCGVALSGCASPGGGASTHNDVSRCAAVLPTARDVVHGQGRLVLVRPLKQIDVDTIVRDASHPVAGATTGTAPPASTAPPTSTAPPASTAPPTSTAAPTSTVATPGAPHRAQGAHPPVAHPQGAHPQAAQHPGTPGRAPRLCLVVYEGNFRADAIPGAQPTSATGKYALIFLRVRHPSVDRTLITDVLPASTHRPWWHF